MTAALLTALLYAMSAIFGQRTAKLFGPLRGNALRLLLACALLGILTWIVDGVRGSSSLVPAVYPALFWSGIVGFGLGDVGLYLAYPRLGARLTILINFSLATLFAAWGDRVLLGQHLTLPQWGGVVCILSGLAVALWPERGPGARAAAPWSGLAFATLSAAGQGFGTTLSGWANQIASANHVTIHGISQAFQRCTAGVLFAVGVWLVWRVWLKRPDHVPEKPDKKLKRKHAGFWLTGAALFGPVAGVSCYQWARMELPSAIVVAVVATSTLWVIPLAKLIEKDHPTFRQIAGALLAAAGIAALALVK
jgi:drug/metabolite transporter (DMT)-like permease